MYVSYPTEGRSSGINTSCEGDCDPPTTMGQSFANHVCHKESLRSQTVKDIITPDEQTDWSRSRGTPRCPNLGDWCEHERRHHRIEFGSTCGNLLEPNAPYSTQLNVRSYWVSTYVCSTVCDEGTIQGWGMWIQRRTKGPYFTLTPTWTGLNVRIPHSQQHGLPHSSSVRSTWLFGRWNSDKYCQVNQKCWIFDHHTDCVPLTDIVVLTSTQTTTPVSRSMVRNHPDLEKKQWVVTPRLTIKLFLGYWLIW